jgi:hypothetical protein
MIRRRRRRPGRYLFGRAFLDPTLMGSGGAEDRRRSCAKSLLLLIIFILLLPLLAGAATAQNYAGCV